MLRTIVCFAGVLFLAGAPVVAQPGLKFEVASIKPTSPDAHGSSIMTDKVGGLNATNMPIKALITMAYGIRDFQLSGGPGWVGTERYDIIAKPERAENAPEPPDIRTMTDAQIKTRDELWRERARALLAERFGLVIHKETKEEQIYVLSVGKGGPRLTEITTPGDRQGMNMNTGRLQGFAAPISMLTSSLSNSVGRPVIDKTGLIAKYDFVLQWTPVAGASAPDGTAAVDTTGPTLFTALQEQLGLKLESTKGPVDTYVIDRIDRPSEN